MVLIGRLLKKACGICEADTINVNCATLKQPLLSTILAQTFIGELVFANTSGLGIKSAASGEVVLFLLSFPVQHTKLWSRVLHKTFACDGETYFCGDGTDAPTGQAVMFFGKAKALMSSSCNPPLLMVMWLSALL